MNVKSPEWDSNPQSPAYKAGALPIELSGRPRQGTAPDARDPLRSPYVDWPVMGPLTRISDSLRDPGAAAARGRWLARGAWLLAAAEVVVAVRITSPAG